MKESNMSRADFITSVVLIAFGSGVMTMSARMPRLEERGIDPFTAPGVVPFFLGAIITLLAVDNTFTTPRAFKPFEHGAAIAEANKFVHQYIEKLFLFRGISLGFSYESIKF